MTTSLARYHARAPRYILDTVDNNLIRLSGAERRSWEEATEIKDISLTGLSFTAPADLSPQLGEMVKIQFSVPGSEQMACYAVTIRIERTSSYENLIGVHFFKLDRVQRLNLVQGLSARIQYHPTVAVPAKESRYLQIIAILGLVFAVLSWLTLMKLYFL
ncbi:MAG: PilZ domain-containing protein [Bdellovibrionaceae bacterium]|nr:PilZ domain-containing protein [Bdellovibrio sp.]